MINKILQNKNLIKTFKIIGIISPIVVIFIFSSKSKFLQKTNTTTETIPLIISLKNPTINTTQPFTSPSKLEFVLPDNIPTFNQSINTYTIEKKLVNENTIKNITSLLNFY